MGVDDILAIGLIGIATLIAMFAQPLKNKLDPDNTPGNMAWLYILIGTGALSFLIAWRWSLYHVIPEGTPRVFPGDDWIAQGVIMVLWISLWNKYSDATYARPAAKAAAKSERIKVESTLRATGRMPIALLIGVLALWPLAAHATPGVDFAASLARPASDFTARAGVAGVDTSDIPSPYSIRRLSVGGSVGGHLLHLDTDSTFGRHAGAFYNVYANWSLASRLGLNGGFERTFTPVKGLGAFSYVWAGASMLLPGDSPTSRLYLKVDYIRMVGSTPFEHRETYRAGLQYVWGTLMRKAHTATGRVVDQPVVFGLGRGLYDVNNGVTSVGAALRAQPIGGK